MPRPFFRRYTGSMHIGRTLILLAIVPSMLGLMSGCEPSAIKPASGLSNASNSHSSGKPSAKSGGAGNPAARWPFWPVAMRIHPLTRLMITSNKDGPAGSTQWLIETRIEFKDAEGLPSKASGQLTIQLYDSAGMSPDQGRVKTWNVDLRDLAVNRAQFDDITRTYLFRLSIDPSELTEQSQLRAMFVSVDGQQFEDRLLVKH